MASTCLPHHSFLLVYVLALSGYTDMLEVENKKMHHSNTHTYYGHIPYSYATSPNIASCCEDFFVEKVNTLLGTNKSEL